MEYYKIIRISKEKTLVVNLHPMSLESCKDICLILNTSNKKFWNRKEVTYKPIPITLLNK